MADWVGQIVSKVEIQRLLGRGGMADVYLGLHTTLNRPVAVKILHAHLMENASLLSRFRSEAQSVATMRHPNIVQVLDFDIVDDRPYIVMELLEGITLRDYLQQHRDNETRIAPAAIMHIVASLARALDYAHERGIIHRDIKPANIMLRHEGDELSSEGLWPSRVDVVLTDFGIARIADSAANTASGTIVGTPAYMSPEQVRSELVDARSDIYSLGIVLYEMLSGELPFDGDSQASLLIKQISEIPAPIQGASPEVQRILDRVLSKTPDQRYDRASDLATELQAAIAEGDAIQPNARPARETARRRSAAESVLLTRDLKLDGDSGTQMGTELPHQTVQTATTGTSPAIWIVGIIGGLALIASLAALFGHQITDSAPSPAAPSPAAPSPTSLPPTATGQTPVAGLLDPASTDSVGMVLIHDDVVTVNLTGVDAPPEGMRYEAWLTESGSGLFSLGPVIVKDGQITLETTDSDGRNLLAAYDGFALSLEPDPDDDPAVSGDIAYAGYLTPEQVSHLRLLFDVNRDVSFRDMLINGLTQQSLVYDSHIENTINAINANNLAAAKSHAEHVINILVGRESPEYLDYDGNGRTENPGDGGGLSSYLQVMRDALIATASIDETQSSDLHNRADNVESFLLTGEDMKNDALSITAADAIEEIVPLREDLWTLKLQRVVTELADQVQDDDLSVGIEIFPTAK